MAAIGHIPVAFHSVLPEPQQIKNYTDVISELRQTQHPDQARQVSPASTKHLAHMEGSRLLPGPLSNTDPHALKNTEITKPMAKAPANDTKAAARERNRVEKFAARSYQWTKAKVSEIAYSIRRMRLSPGTIHTIEIQDWDDNLRSEQKGINYRLMHNGVAMAAEKYGSQFPQLIQINNALKAQREQPQEVEGMPWICHTAEGFEKYAMNQEAIKPQHFRPAIVNNLLDNIHLLDPSIKIDDGTKDTIFHLIFSNFNNQYERMIDPTDWSTVASKPSENERADLPFPNPELLLMDGAKNYLQKMQPDVLRLLISNRMHPHVRKELERCGMQKFFHYVTGTPLVSVYRPADVADAEHVAPSDLDKALQQTFEKKNVDIAALAAEKADEAKAGAPGQSPEDRDAVVKYGDKMETLKPALDAEDKDTALRWKQHQHTTVEQLYRKPDQTLLIDSIQAFLDAGLKFSKRVKFVTVGDTGKDVTQAYDLLASGGKVADGVAISKSKGIIVNPGRQQQVDAARDLAKQRGLNIDIDHVPSFNQVKL